MRAAHVPASGLAVAFGLAVAVALSLVACGAPPSASAPRDAPAEATAVASSTVVASSTALASAAASPLGSASAPPAAPSSAEPLRAAAPLAVSSRFSARRIFDRPAVFVVTGEDGRLGVLADEDGQLVPHRRENGAWQRLPLPASQADSVTKLRAGIYFGRDNRPRFMGYHDDGASSRIAYLRFKDGKWQPELREIGPLGKDGPAPLFGVLGEADPEVVCRVGDRCLIKSRKGWKETPASIPPDAVVRAFSGHGYALTSDGLFRADDKAFVRVGPPAPWRSRATGFWVGPDGAAVVVEPGAGLVHVLDAAAKAWATEPSPIEHPLDVAGPPEDRWFASDAGLAHRGADGVRRVDGVAGVSRVIVTSLAVIAGGSGGVFEIVAR